MGALIIYSVNKRAEKMDEFFVVIASVLLAIILLIIFASSHDVFSNGYATISALFSLYAVLRS